MDLPDPSIITAVQDLYARYAHRIDRRDFDGFAALFTEDGTFFLGDDSATGRAAIGEFMRGVMKAPGGAHVITNVSVRPDGKDRWSVVADYLLTRRTEEEGPWGIVGVGWYEAVATWVDGEWYLAEHRIVPAVSDDPVVSYGDRVAFLAEADPTSPVVRVVAVDGTETVVTWPELHRRSTQIARALQTRGATAGTRVAVGLRNSPEFVMTVLAAWKLGAVPVPVRWDLPEWERARVLQVIDGVSVGADDLPWLHATADDDATPLPSVVPHQTNGICSSGSTGAPKVILMDKPGVFDDMTGMPFAASWGPVTRPQTVLVMAPMYHTNGFATLFSLLAGDRLVVLEKFDALRIVDLIEAHGVTTFTATTVMLQRIADLPGVDDRDLSSIVWILQGAAVISETLVRRWIDLLGAERFYQSYGMTEGIGLCSIRGDEWLEHPGSVGRGFRGTEIRILDPDGTELPPGETGEIYMKSPASGMFQYLGGAPLPPRTVDGFSTGGDLGWLEPDGYLHIVDRRVDMIITGGANVFPAEIESALIDHPGIADVVVIGLQDPEWGRRVHAVIEPADPASPPTVDDVRAYAKSRLAAYKVPKTVEFVDAIPRSEATKVSRTALVDARGG